MQSVGKVVQMGSDAKDALQQCSPADLVRNIERMRLEIEKIRAAAGITTPFQVNLALSRVLAGIYSSVFAYFI